MAAPPTTHDRRALLDVAQVASQLGLTKAHVYQMIARGELVAMDLKPEGRTKPIWRIRARELDRYLTSKEQRGEGS